MATITVQCTICGNKDVYVLPVQLPLCSKCNGMSKPIKVDTNANLIAFPVPFKK